MVRAVSAGGEGPSSGELSATPSASAELIFRRGDADGNGALELTDVIRSLNFKFVGGEQNIIACPDAADVDDNGLLELTDDIRSLNFQFVGVEGTLPESPGPFNCGPDVNEDSLPDCEYPKETCQ